MPSYTDAFRDEMCRRMLTPPGVTLKKLAHETGVSKTNLWLWRKEAKAMAGKSDKKWTPEEKLRVLLLRSALVDGRAIRLVDGDITERARGRPRPMMGFGQNSGSELVGELRQRYRESALAT